MSAGCIWCQQAVFYVSRLYFVSAGCILSVFCSDKMQLSTPYKSVGRVGKVSLNTFGVIILKANTL
jgi:hypothetical protein